MRAGWGRGVHALQSTRRRSVPLWGVLYAGCGGQQWGWRFVAACCASYV